MYMPANETKALRRKTHKMQPRPPFECIALLLQGGGALGAYQAGVYEALSEAHLYPDWVAGISVGAINSALIAGNPPEARFEKLRKFWELVTTPPLSGGAAQLAAATENGPFRDLLDHATDMMALVSAMSLTFFSSEPLEGHAAKIREFWENTGRLFAARGDVVRGLMNQVSAGVALAHGANAFFARRIPAPWLQPAGTVEATGYYDNAQLKATLESLVDFDRINAAEMRFSVGAVNVSTGNFVYFDNSTHVIGPEHVMASCALPPGFPPVEIEGECYWDGGIVSNTPLQWVLESEPRQDTLAFQVDLWSARGAIPRNMAEVETRRKEIQYSSRTRASTDQFKHSQKIRNALSNVLHWLPEKQYEGHSKDYEFSRLSMEDHWRAGYHDTVRTLRHPEVVGRPDTIEGVLTFVLAQDGRE